MLRNRLWSGLGDLELKNVSRYLFEKKTDYYTLRLELRVIEDDLRQHRISASSINKAETKHMSSSTETVKVSEEPDTVSVRQFASSVDSRLLKEMQTMSKQMEVMNFKSRTLRKKLKILNKTAVVTALVLGQRKRRIRSLTPQRRI